MVGVKQAGVAAGALSIALLLLLSSSVPQHRHAELESLNPDVENELGNPSWEDVGVRTGYSDPEPFFSAPQGSLAMGYGDGYEWPYVWSGSNLRGDSSGYDWEGAATTAQARGLQMPPSHDVFGDIGPFGRLEAPEARAYRVDSYETAVPMESLPLYRGAMGAKAPRVSMLRAMGKQARLQTLKNSWTDYGMDGSPMKCTCDSSAAGDEEMEGLNPNVKPACTCTGGRVTQFTKTEEGGPLDTGAKGGWPQGILDTKGVAYIDGGSQQAYKARPQILVQRPEHPVKLSKRAFSVLRELAEKGSDMLAEESEMDQDGDESEPAGDVEASKEDSKAEEEKEEKEEEKEGKSDKEEDKEEETKEDKEEKAEEKEDEERDEKDEDKEEEDKDEKDDKDEDASEEGEESGDSEDETEEGAEDEEVVTADDLAKDPAASGIDKELLGHFKKAFTKFLDDADGCDGTGACDESLCMCERKAGRHMCYSLQAAFDQCPYSKLKVCDLEALKEAKGLCKQVEKLPGVNVDNVPVMNEMVPDSGGTQKHFFYAPDGVYQ